MRKKKSELRQYFYNRKSLILANFLVNHPCEVYSAPFDVRLPEEDEMDEDVITAVQPDIVVICEKKSWTKKAVAALPI